MYRLPETNEMEVRRADRESPSALTLHNVRKTLGGTEVLKGVSLQVGKGEFLTLLGPSGSGKTTLLRAIAGFVRPDTGDIFINGRNMMGIAPNKRNIGMVFQDYALFPHLTVEQNIAYPLHARSMAGPLVREATAKIIDIVGLSAMAKRRPAQLSGGQQQRVALARALVFSPELVLLDEPMSALDKKLRGQMQLEILRITRQLGATVVSVTHDQDEALSMSDKIAVFSSGSLVQAGTPQEIYEAPRTQFVADFIGDANIIPAKVVSRAGRTALSCMDADLGQLSEAHSGRFSEGDRVSLVVRPEHVAFRHYPAPIDERQSGLPAVVQHAVYVGTDWRIVVRVGEQVIQIRSRDMQHSAGLKQDERVWISWDPMQMVVLG
jgi:putative spermidine/putrescine transport system ATP-binding protein